MRKCRLCIVATFIILAGSKLSAIDLKKVTVSTDTKFSQSIQEITTNVDILTYDNIEERGFRSINKALSTLSGINLSRQGGLGQSSSLKLRGFDSKRVLVLIDGVRYNNPTGRSGAEFSHLMADNIEKIEVIKGPQSGIWGADASAGVINIITKKDKRKGLNLSIHGEFGTFSSKTYGLSTSYIKDRVELFLNLLQVKSDGYSSLAPYKKEVKKFEDDGYKNSSADIKLSLNITKRDRVELFYNTIDTFSEFDYKDPNDNNSSVNSKSYFYGLKYLKNSKKNHIKAYIHRSNFKREYPTNPKRDYSGYVDEIGLNSKRVYMKNSQIITGVDYKKFKLTNRSKKSYSNQGIFISNSNRFDNLAFGKTVFSQSIRYDKFEKFDNRFTYKIGVKHTYKNIQDLTTSLNYATAYNIPTLYQLYSHVGNIDLNPERTKGFDIALSYRDFKATYFSSRVKEMIEYVIENPKTFEGSFYNLSKESKLDGIELSYDASIESMALAYKVNYTYLKAVDSSGKKLLRRPTNSLNISLDNYTISNTHVGALIQYVGKRDDKHQKLSGYVVVDFICDYDISDNLNIYVKIDNIFDKKYQEISGYATDSRSFYAGFRYKLR